MMKNKRSKFLTFIFSLMPGAGHMYQGFLKTGTIYMAAFFFISFLAGFTRIGLLTILLPIIWFYSFFDSYHIYNGEKVEEDMELLDIKEMFSFIQSKHIGYFLIFIGVLSLFKKIFYPNFISLLMSLGVEDIYRFNNYIETIAVASILIYVGLKISKSNIILTEDDGDKEDEN